MSFPILSLVMATSMATSAATAASPSPIGDPQSQARALLTAHVDFQSPMHSVLPGKRVGERDTRRLDVQEQAAVVIRGSHTSTWSGMQRRIVLRATPEKHAEHPSRPDAQEIAARLLGGIEY